MKRMKMLALLTGLLVAWVVKTTTAQRYPFYNLNVENGLIQSQARGLAQDRDGNLWISTLGGLSRFDGESFTNYTVRNGMLSNDINTVAADATGKIWIGFSKGISSYDGKSFKHYRLQSTEVDDGNVVTDIITSTNGTWCVSSGKVFRIVGSKIKELLLPDGNAKATALLYSGGRLYIACNNGMLYSQKEGIFDSVGFRVKNAIPTVLDIFRDSRNRLWLATSHGPLQVMGERVEPVTVHGVSLAGVSTLSITEDKQGALWLALPNGVLSLTDSTLHLFNKRNGLSDNPFYKLLTDREGNVWMASDGQGVFRFSGAQFTSIDERTGLPSAQVMSIASDYHGKLFLGTYDAGLYVFEKNRISKLKLPLEGDLPIMALNYVDEILWIGTAGAGLLRYEKGRLTAYTTENSSLPSNYVASLYYNEEKQLLIGTLNGGALFKDNRFSILPIKGTIVHSAINIGDDSLLVATGNGLELIYKDQAQPFITGKAPDSASPKCMLKTGNELWIGTSDNGAICYNLATKQALVLNKNNGMRSDFVYNLMADNDGNIWAGTGYGIHKIVKNEKGTVSIFFYGREQGISGMESNLNSVLKMPDGSIWFGTTNGAQHYQPSNKMVISEPSSLVLHSVKIFGEDIKDTTYFDSTGAWYNIPYGLRLPPRKNNVTFTFHAITLAGKEQIRYRYKIANLDAMWSEWTDVNTVTYSALPPGRHKFLVQCAVTGTNKVSKELAFPFEIITPFHQTWLFRFIILGACILLGVTLQYAANKRKQNRLKLMQALRKEEQDKVRQRTAEDFHDEVGNKLTRINILTNVLKNKIGVVTPDAERIIHQIQDNTGQLYSGTRDILWSLKPTNDNLYEILHRIRDFGGELFQDTDIEFIFEGTDERWQNHRLPLDVSRNLIMIFKEALNNCLKYSKATQVFLKARLHDDDVLEITLTDDGKGFDMETVRKGHGLDNMHIRAKRISGNFKMVSSSGNGTSISLNFKLPQDLPSKRG